MTDARFQDSGYPVPPAPSAVLTQEVLFLCSGNFYRSRFAEAVFNFHAARRSLPVRAFSRGLATWLVFGEGPLSPHARRALADRNIPLSHTGPHPTALSHTDLERAHRIIALKEEEHRPLLRQQFPDWENRVAYWTIHDVDAASPAEAIPLLEDQVLALLEAYAPPPASAPPISKIEN